MSHSQHKGMSEPAPSDTTTSAPAATGTSTTAPDASDTVPDVAPGTTTVKTNPALWGLFGGSATETTIPAPPEASTTAAAVVASKAPSTQPAPPAPPKQPTATQQATSAATTIFWEFFYAFLYILMVGLGAGAFYLNAQRFGVEVPAWLILLVSVIPFTQWLSILTLFVVTVFTGLPDMSVLRGKSLWGIFGTGVKPVQVPGA